jgi:serine protease Do
MTAPNSGPPPPTGVERAAALIRPAIVEIQARYSGYVIDEDGVVLNNLFNGGAPYEVAWSCTGFGVNAAGFVATAGHCVDTTGPAASARTAMLRVVAEQIHEYAPHLAVSDIVSVGLGNSECRGRREGVAGRQPDSRDQRRHVGRLEPGGGEARSSGGSPPLPRGRRGTAEGREHGPALGRAGSRRRCADRRTRRVVGYAGSGDIVTDPSLEPTNKDGTISSKATHGTIPVYETSAALTGGMSGGPTIGFNGQVLGVNSFKPAGETQAFNFVMPAAGLSELLTRNGVHNELGPQDRLYRDGLTAYFDGHYTDAIAIFDRLLQSAPNYHQATRYKTLAAKAREQYGDTPVPGLFPWWWIAGGAVMLAGMATGLTLIARKGTPPTINAAVPLAPVPTFSTTPGWATPTAVRAPQASHLYGSSAVATGAGAARAAGPPPAPGLAAVLDRPASGRGADSSTARANMPWPGSTSGNDFTSTAVRVAACPSCATPYPAGARYCAMCGIGL